MRADLALIGFILTLAGGITLLVLRRRRGGVPLLLGGIVLLLAAAAFALYAAAAAQRVPPGAIGQADAMTNIRIEGAGFDVTLLLLAAGILAAAFAILQFVRAARSGRRAP